MRSKSYTSTHRRLVTRSCQPNAVGDRHRYPYDFPSTDQDGWGYRALDADPNYHVKPHPIADPQSHQHGDQDQSSWHPATDDHTH